LAFNRHISETTFRDLPAGERPQALLRAVVLPDGNATLKERLLELSLPNLEREIDGIALADVVETRRRTGLRLGSFRQNQIEGTVLLEQKSVLVVQTPFDRGWRAWQDGQAAQVLKVDIGLLGVALDAGEHKVELSYRNPYLAAGLAVTLGSLLFLAVGMWRWPRLRGIA
ncbi:MAG: YfhO family protein, partial [Verrucomicrobiaceae bacterium]|nr:YfhO family protein [Verrucomicrobiaceae bacterium]